MYRLALCIPMEKNRGMGIINLTDREQTSIKAIDDGELIKAIDRSVREESSSPLYGLSLSSCGDHISHMFRAFEQAVASYQKAKLGKKHEGAHLWLIRAGSDLRDAIRRMKDRVDVENKERELFYVDDNIHWPLHFSKTLVVTIPYQWRKAVEDEWKHGSITFHHEVIPDNQLSGSHSRQKTSAKKRELLLQAELSSTRQNLLLMTLCSVRDYFRSGRDGSKIPKDFRIRTDPHSGSLNNRSAEFWEDPS